MNIRNEIKAHIVQEGTTMSEVVRTLAVVHGWSASDMLPKRQTGK